MYHYKQRVLRELEGFGIIPLPTTSPALIRDFLHDLYIHEIRTLKHQQVTLERERGPGARKGYANRVVALRRKYPLLSLPPRDWLDHC